MGSHPPAVRGCQETKDTDDGRRTTMSELVTLRSLMGMAEGPAPLSQSALVMIDCQNTYREGLMALVLYVDFMPERKQRE